MIDDQLFANIEGYSPRNFLEEIEFSQTTELRAKQIFVGLFRNNLRYVLEAKNYFHNDGTRWRRDGGDVALGLAQTVPRRLYRYASETNDVALASDIGKFAVFCESRRVIQAMVALAQSDEQIVSRVSDFDRDPFLLNTVTGTIDLRSGCLREHRREDMITKIAGVPYDAAAHCKRWERFMREVFVGKPDVVDFVQRAVGYSLTGDTREEAMFIAHGRGMNGKSTFLETVKRMSGDYGTTCDSDLLLARGRHDSSNDIARLAGARFVSCVEVNQGRALDESRVKAMTSSDTMSARFLFQEFFEFRPELKLWLGTNYRPEIRGTDDGIWRRVRLIPFEGRFQGVDRDLTLAATLTAELPGILAWAVRGCLAWQDRGLDAPLEVVAATNAYRSESDLIGEFITERCETRDELEVGAGTLYAGYRAWAESGGEKPVNSTTFGRNMSERGFDRDRKRTPGRHGIALRCE